MKNKRTFVYVSKDFIFYRQTSGLLPVLPFTDPTGWKIAKRTELVNKQFLSNVLYESKEGGFAPLVHTIPGQVLPRGATEGYVRPQHTEEWKSEEERPLKNPGGWLKYEVLVGTVAPTVPKKYEPIVRTDWTKDSEYARKTERNGIYSSEKYYQKHFESLRKQFGPAKQAPRQPSSYADITSRLSSQRHTVDVDKPPTSREYSLFFHWNEMTPAGFQDRKDFWDMIGGAAAGDSQKAVALAREEERGDYWSRLVMNSPEMSMEERRATMLHFGHDPGTEYDPAGRNIDDFTPFWRQTPQTRLINNVARKELTQELLDAIMIDKFMGKNPKEEEVMKALSGLYANEKIIDRKTGEQITPWRLVQLLNYKDEDEVMQMWFGPPDKQRMTLNYGAINDDRPYLYNQGFDTSDERKMAFMAKTDLFYEGEVQNLVREVVMLRATFKMGGIPVAGRARDLNEARTMLRELKRQNSRYAQIYNTFDKYGPFSEMRDGKPYYGVRGPPQNITNWASYNEPTTLTSDIFEQDKFTSHFVQGYMATSFAEQDIRSMSKLPKFAGVPFYGSKNVADIAKNVDFQKDSEAVYKVAGDLIRQGRSVHLVLPISAPGNYRDAQIVTMDASVALNDMKNLETSVVQQMMKFAQLGVRPVVMAATDYIRSAEVAIDTYTGRTMQKNFGWVKNTFVDPFSGNVTASRMRIGETVNNQANMVAIDFINPTYSRAYMEASVLAMKNEPRYDYYNYSDEIFQSFMSESPSVPFRKDVITNVRHVIFPKDAISAPFPGFRGTLDKYDDALKAYLRALPSPPSAFTSKGIPNFVPPDLMEYEAYKRYDQLARHAIGMIEQGKLLKQKWLVFDELNKIIPDDVDAEDWMFMNQRMQYDLEHKLNTMTRAMPIDKSITRWKGIEVYDERNELHKHPEFWSKGGRNYSKTDIEYNFKRGLGSGQEWVNDLDARLDNMERPDWEAAYVGGGYREPSGFSTNYRDRLSGVPYVTAADSVKYGSTTGGGLIHPDNQEKFMSPYMYIPRHVDKEGNTVPGRYVDMRGFTMSKKDYRERNPENINYDSDMARQLRMMRKSVNANVPPHVITEWEMATSQRDVMASYALSNMWKDYTGVDTSRSKEDRLLREERWIKKTDEAKSYAKLNYPTVYSMYMESLAGGEGAGYRTKIMVEFMRHLMDLDMRYEKELARVKNRVNVLNMDRERVNDKWYDIAQSDAMTLGNRITRDMIRKQASAIRRRRLEMERSLKSQRKVASSDEYDYDLEDLPYPDKVERAGRKFESDYKEKLILYASSRIQSPFLGQWDILKHWTPTLNDLIWMWMPPSKYYGYLKLSNDLKWMMTSNYGMRSAEMWLGATARGRAGLTKKPYRRQFRRMVWTTTWGGG